ncbi:hypothetical protein [Candidatus Scalindua japonica]|nr:hypothetical protein [Candidatus Scalindua japonica]
MLCTILSSLIGCGISREGAVDYRKANIMDMSEKKELVRIKEESLDSKKASGAIQNTPLLPVKLVRQALQSNETDAKIEKLNSITIRLRRALIKEFTEIPLNPIRGFKANGEIAIVVKAFEFGEGEDFDFTPEGVKEGRVVFYSSDVEEDQILNFNNMPIYGPIQYNGNPIGLDFFIMELDTNDEQIAALLSTLASFGAMAYPPAAPILPVLDSLGKSLLKGNTNDIGMRFSLVLDPPEGYAGLSYPSVEAGNYVLLREDNRQAVTKWDALVLDDNNGLLYNNTTDKQGLYRDNTYLTFQVNKGFNSKNLDLSQNKFGPFLDKLKEEDARKAAELNGVFNEIKKVGFARMQKRNFTNAKVILSNLKSAIKNNKQNIAKRTAYDLFKLIKKAVPPIPDPNPGSENLSSEQRIYLLKALRSMAKASASFSDLEIFEDDWFRRTPGDTIFNTLFPLIK